MAEQLLTVDQVAEYLNIAKFTLYRLVAHKQVPAFKVGNQWRFKRKMIETWLRKNSNVQKKRLHLGKPIDRGEQTADELFKLDQVKIKKALIVEDHPDLLYILTRLLESLGFTVVSATHGSEGVEKAVKEKPHLILMDILMPGMDGREATRLIRSNPETQDIPILAATVLNRRSELQTCIEAGCNDWLVKRCCPIPSCKLRLVATPRPRFG